LQATPSFGKIKAKKTKMLDSYRVPSKIGGKRIHPLFGRLKEDRKKFFNSILSVSKFENLRRVLHKGIEKNNARLGRSIRTEERLALTVRLVHTNV
jgi:hypothetical protein